MKAAFAVLGLIVAACHALDGKVPGLDTTYTVIKEPTVHEAVEGAAPVSRKVTNGQIAEVHLIGMVKETEAGTGYKFIDTKEEEKEFHHIKAGDEGADVTGLTQGLIGMGPGEVRKFEIPPHEGYGDIGMPAWKIPAQATLIYTVEVLDIHDADYSPPHHEVHDEL